MVVVGVSGDLEEVDGDSSSFPECPRCGTVILATAVSGPVVGTATPCGCRVLPPELGLE